MTSSFSPPSRPDPLPPAILLLGPTASGKSAAALELARQFPIEIISVDSAQVYRDMDIGTAKPDGAERAACPHHLIDILTPEQSYSAARFRDDALRLMHEITARGRVPLLAGGTMLYFKALREGLSTLPPADPGIRAQIDEAAMRHGWPVLHAQLAALDPQTAARLKPNDAQRIQRALEVVRLTGRPMAECLAQRESAALPFRLLAVGLAPSDRSVLHGRIAQRFEAMLAAGLVDELRALREKYPLDSSLPSMRCVGYRQAWDFLDGRIDAAALHDKGIFATRQLAKRQLTWMRGMPDLEMFDCCDTKAPASISASVAARLNGIRL
ncbi:MAG: tRNA (adenosine(37)-N6)-dimethylallyltransferase MiaA [Sterolibacteriaceae bacterium]|nr:tRNA (adenosine(37)-N6)-dimethylallyltransferase MiaA [Candidatus Methylophosphatis haderslevensis]